MTSSPPPAKPLSEDELREIERSGWGVEWFSMSQDTADRVFADLRRCREALRSLANECDGLAAFEPLVREAIGNTNWACLRTRVDEARTALGEP